MGKLFNLDETVPIFSTCIPGIYVLNIHINDNVTIL